jgi:hypothetical protein
VESYPLAMTLVLTWGLLALGEKLKAFFVFILVFILGISLIGEFNPIRRKYQLWNKIVRLQKRSTPEPNSCAEVCVPGTSP